MCQCKTHSMSVSGVTVYNIFVYTFGLKQMFVTKSIFDDYDDDTNAAVFPHKDAPCSPKICISLTYSSLSNCKTVITGVLRATESTQ